MKKLISGEISIHRGNLILVNKQTPIRGLNAQEIEGLVPLAGTRILLNQEAERQLNLLMRELDGWKRIEPVSGWRSREEQESLFFDSVRENGLEYTTKYVALPDCSEHQTGLAIDLALKNEKIDLICPAFPYEGVCREFRNLAAGFGFVERYPKGKETITGIAHEPWHFRYVGKPHAQIMEQHGMVLEEYHQMLREFPFGSRALEWVCGGESYRVAYHPAAKGLPQILETQQVSGDNMDGFIVTEWGD